MARRGVVSGLLIAGVVGVTWRWQAFRSRWAAAATDKVKVSVACRSPYRHSSLCTDGVMSELTLRTLPTEPFPETLVTAVLPNIPTPSGMECVAMLTSCAKGARSVEFGTDRCPDHADEPGAGRGDERSRCRAGNGPRKWAGAPGGTSEVRPLGPMPKAQSIGLEVVLAPSHPAELSSLVALALRPAIAPIPPLADAR